jgi:hypothetical protein
MPSRLEHRLFLFLIVTMVWSTAMGFEAGAIVSPDSHQSPPNCYISGKAILDVELSPTAECFESVVRQEATDHGERNIRLIRTNTYMDFLFILLYWSVFVLFARVEEGRWSNWVTGFISSAALFDALENTRILKGLSALSIAAHVEGLLPRPFSLVKWTLLGLGFCTLGILVWSRKGRLYRLLTAALLASGVLTLGGLAIPKSMVYAVYGFALVFVLLLARIWPYPFASVLQWIEYGYLARFQLLAALLLALALPLAYHFVPSVFIGLFDGRGFFSFLFIVWAAFQMAWTIMVTFRLVLVYGPDRFMRASSIHAGRVGTGTVALFGLLALPVVTVLFLGTSEPPGVWKALAAFLGLLLAIAVLALTASLHFAIEDPAGHSAEAVFPSFGFLGKTTRPSSSFWNSIGLFLARLPPDLTKGILDGTRLRSGHEMATIALGVFLLLYAILGVVFSPAWLSPDRQPAALLFLLLLLTVFTWFLSGAAFFLDRTRLPVFATLLAISLLTGFFGTDHEFKISEAKVLDAGGLRPTDVVHSWEKGVRRKKSPTITIVATAGGGIRAAAWTAEVMTRLQEQCGEKLSSSLLLVSSVSGGSVGSMFVVGPYSSENGDYPLTEAKLQPIRSNASRSSLSAVGWGLAYPDLARTAPLFGSLVKQTIDRGWSLENAWETPWREAQQPPPLMSTWREDVRAGTRPAVIFNATTSESGERFLIASTDTKSEGTVEFFDRFPNSDLHVATAARLSATFPYASPLARPSAGPIANAYHIGDGGYYDNSGMLSAIEWLRDAGTAVQGYNVLLILIDAKPGTPKSGSLWSWQKQLVGPLETVLNVRTSSQRLRDSIELNMAVDYVKAQTHKDVTAVPFLFSSDSPAPLSWHLTESQIAEIGTSWRHGENVEAAKVVYGQLGCPATTP